jgi:hypothetical protein
MKNLIYYPGFEMQQKNWLKFALLYIDTLNPIIPRSGDRQLTDLHRKLLGETDLIQFHRPETQEGWLATLDAIDQTEKVITRPKSYSPVFGEGDFVSAWKSLDNHDYTLFKEKYSDDWKHFCLANNFATEVDEGIKLHQDLAFVYMTLLAHTIGDARGIAPISDYPTLDKFAIFTQKVDQLESKNVEVAQAVIELELPANFEEIQLDDLISLRNRPGFKERLAAFHQQFDEYFDSVEKGSRPGKFVASLDSIWNDFSDDILITGIGAVSFGVGLWITMSSPQAGMGDYLKAIAGGATLTVGGAVKIKNTWKNTKTKRYTRKYLTDLTRLRPTSFS